MERKNEKLRITKDRYKGKDGTTNIDREGYQFDQKTRTHYLAPPFRGCHSKKEEPNVCCNCWIVDFNNKSSIQFTRYVTDCLLLTYFILNEYLLRN